MLFSLSTGEKYKRSMDADD